MKIAALVTTLLLGTSSAALAEPTVLRGPADHQPAAEEHIEVTDSVIETYAPPPTKRQHPGHIPGAFPAGPSSEAYMERLPGAYDHHAPYGRWSVIASGRLMRGALHAPMYGAVRAHTLKLEALRGPVFVDRVIVTFANGRTRVLEVDRWISARGGALIDLPGGARQITAVTIHGRGARRSAPIQVLAA